MRPFFVTSAGVVLALLIGIPLTTSAQGGPQRVLICHVPPGNPGSARTLTLPEPAVQAHLSHGDTIGACGGGRVGDGPPWSGGETGRGTEPRTHGGGQAKKRQPSGNERVDTGAGSNGGHGELNQPQTGGGVGQTGQDQGSRNKQPDTPTAGNRGSSGSERGDGGQGERGGGGQAGRGKQGQMNGGRQSDSGQPTSNRELNTIPGGNGRGERDKPQQVNSGGPPKQGGEPRSSGGGQRGNNNPQQDSRRVDQASGGRRDASGGNTKPQSGQGGTENSNPAPKKKGGR